MGFRTLVSQAQTGAEPLIATASGIARASAICVYLASLALVPFHTLDPRMEMSGFGILLLGWAEMLDHRVYAWLANPLVIFSFIRMKKSPALCTVLCFAALLLSHDFDKVASLGWDSSQDVRMGRVVALGAGSYVWIGSLVAALLACGLHWLARRREIAR